MTPAVIPEIAGREILSMLQPQGAALGMSHVEPEPLSTDEFMLWLMQEREDAEIGANSQNNETFGDGIQSGWTFQENLAANERIAQQGLPETVSPQSADASRERPAKEKVKDLWVERLRLDPKDQWKVRKIMSAMLAEDIHILMRSECEIAEAKDPLVSRIRQIEHEARRTPLPLRTAALGLRTAVAAGAQRPRRCKPVQRLRRSLIHNVK